jgi:hypothetical protein
MSRLDWDFLAALEPFERQAHPSQGPHASAPRHVGKAGRTRAVLQRIIVPVSTVSPVLSLRSECVSCGLGHAARAQPSSLAALGFSPARSPDQTRPSSLLRLVKCLQKFRPA